MVTSKSMEAPAAAKELDEAWVRSTCIICLNRCGILVHRNGEGYVDQIVGDPDNPHNRGKTCAKGNSGMEGIAPEVRLTTPLRRTNPEKGLGVDPKFEPVSWDEALDEIALRIKGVRDDDPLRFLLCTFDAYHIRGSMLPAFVTAVGAPAVNTWSAQIFCGNNVHGIHWMAQNAFEANPDAAYTEYILHFGSQFGSVIHYDTMKSTRELAGRRPGSLRQVVVDPVCGTAASRAEEWVPIRPGTDAALILGMVNQMINVNGHYDRPFLGQSTNAPYLVGEDEFYVRDPETEKPLVWDTAAQAARPFDAGVTEPALEGRFETHGKPVKTAFQALKDHVTRYTPEFVEEVTTVPGETVTRLAREFGEAARIGETIEIDGVKLPFRPATVTWYRGLAAHKHSFLSGLAVNLLPTLIGGFDVPGGLLGDPFTSRGKATGKGPYECGVSPDGLISQSTVGGGAVAGGIVKGCYPPRKARAPMTPEMFELMPVGPYGAVFYLLTSEKEEVYKPPPFPKMLIQWHSNMMKTSGPPDVVARFLQRIPFIVSIARRREETVEFADIVLPDLHHLERLVPFVYNNIGSGEGSHATYGAKPAVHPPFEHPFEGEYVDLMQVFLEVAKRAGFLNDFNEAINTIAGLKGENRLDLETEYAYEEIVDRLLKNELGPEHDLQWFLEDGLWSEEKTIREKYPRPFMEGRSPVYFEFMKHAGEDLRKVTQELGIPWETGDYQVLPDWKPGPSFHREPPHDLIVINMKVANHALSHTHSNPLLLSLSARHNDLRTVWINTRTAAARGVEDGDRVTIETFEGREQTATARVTELIHPEVLATQGCGGGWTDSTTREEVNFNALLAIDEDHIDFLNGALDSTVSARIFKKNP